VRRTLAAAAAFGLAALALTGCATASAPTCARTTNPGNLASLVQVSGDFAKKPTVDISSPLSPGDGQFVDLTTGTGTEIVSDDQLVGLAVDLFSAKTGKEIVTAGYGSTGPTITPVSTWVQTVPGFEVALKCAGEGTRMIVGLTPTELGSSTASLGLAADESAIAVIDVQKVYLSRADGTPVFNDGHNLPVVVLAPSGQPGVTIPKTDPPTSLVVQTLQKGTGATVGDKDTVRVAYTGLTWADGKVFDSSWGSTPASLSMTGIVPGLAAALKGATVGSQILAVIPPSDGYGSTATGQIPANSTLVFVVDILGIDATQ
jgi:FKBP-type peptidyl-prolyl cis-trans isomerase